MVAYRSMGCTETWTCAPYQTQARPTFGQQIAWGESNAIVFANSVIGARTERYPDLYDICAAITGRVPEVGLHTDDGRRGEILITLTNVPQHLQERDEFYPVLGFVLGRLAEDHIPVVEGLNVHPTDDQFRQAPGDVKFDTPNQIVQMTARIRERAIETETMPFLNKTQMTHQERAELAAWIDQGAKVYQ